ncbi:MULTISPECIES: hypothetical protein [Paenibacillus]|uniref:Uncharacterized protein n=1 Tax=Paenibacillus campinasensis TaxID=66347 RepID=A0A268EML0_9BACL|nr:MULTISPECIES: hypothetical protein [Paenibacillus]MUG66950.1 hypothetical protein [Paenibacillus campinasensis]PAD74355.1 hypothetical protein CHH67_18095 [Paenibacillus campinasensis]PAK50856.1 hypothetical protein CHH75_16640 [Paenibacillus sp. 7541]
MRKDELSFWDSCAARGQEDSRQEQDNQQYDRQGLEHRGASSVVWDRLVKGEAVACQPWHVRLQWIRLE